jgi:hypothetical protein
MTDTQHKSKWYRKAIIASVLAVIAAVVGCNWKACLEAGTYHQAVRYDKPFGPAIAAADRIVVRADGFDCCGPVDEKTILFVATQPDEIAAVAKHIQFEPRTTTNSLLETCMCCGSPGIDWYKQKKRIALTSVQHGNAIRWRGFSTLRIMGVRTGYGDGPLTKESQAWLKQWLGSHGVGNKDTEKPAKNGFLAPAKSRLGSTVYTLCPQRFH